MLIKSRYNQSSGLSPIYETKIFDRRKIMTIKKEGFVPRRVVIFLKLNFKILDAVRISVAGYDFHGVSLFSVPNPLPPRAFL